MTEFFYTDGQKVLEQDIVVLTPNRKARVQFLLIPGTDLARAYAAPHGGIVLKFDDGDCQVWPQLDEDIRFLRRGP